MHQRQFRLVNLFWVVTFFGAVFALLMDGNELVQLIAGSVIAANILGAIAAIFLTHGLGFPTDGSYRHENRSTEFVIDDTDEESPTAGTFE